MKITRLKIDKFDHLSGLDLDLTYPEGHEKAGQPLEKVCIIGQNGTGKTRILELLAEYVKVSTSDANSQAFLPKRDRMRDAMFSESFNEKYPYQEIYFSIFNTNSPIPVEIMSNVHIAHPRLLITDFSIKMDLIPFFVDKKYLKEKKEKSNNAVLGGEDDITNLFLSSRIKKFIAKENNFRVELSLKAEKDSNFLLQDKINEWKIKNKNPLEEIAIVLDPYLNKLGLRIKQNGYLIGQGFELEIQLETIYGEANAVRSNHLSAGISHFLRLAYNIYERMKALANLTKIIVIDEPENSLYPDMQRIIMPYLIDIIDASHKKDNTQLFVATHSPIIASCFEPWEIVELKFKEDGTIYRELYYNGENHVDNYFINPQYLDWDGILRKVFDMQEEGNPIRGKKLVEFATLEAEIKQAYANKILPTQDTEEGRALKEKMLKYKQLGALLDWDFRTIEKK